MIRFACPGCKSVLSGRDEHAGKIVTCPKCGQRMQVPRPTKQSKSRKPTLIHDKPRRKWSAFLALFGILSIGGVVGGLWLWLNAFNPKSGPSIVTHELAPSASRPTVETPMPVEEKPPEEQKSQPTSTPSGERPPPEATSSQAADAPRSEASSPSSKNPIKPRNEEHQSPKPNQPRTTDPTPSAAASSSPQPKDDKPPTAPPLPASEMKEIDLAEDLPPELPFDLVDAINAERTKAGVEPIFLDAEKSRACQTGAEKFARHAARLDDKALSAKDRKEFASADAPLAAIEKWLKEPKQRSTILEPRLQSFGAGFARNVAGQWVSIFDWTCGMDRDKPLQESPISGAIVYPAPGQRRVPLWFPGNETPDPLPQTKDKLAGYPITLSFPPRSQVADADAHLSCKEEGELPVWLSSPEKPANPQFARAQRSTICLIAKKPLRPNTRYQVQATATLNGSPWSAKWDFSTVTPGEIHHEMAGAFLRLLNRQRRRAGLAQVALDAVRSKPCAGHALYLAQNAPVTPMMNWNEEKTDLPGYTPEGAAVARTASIQGGGGPVEAVTGLMDSIISRPQLLDSRLRPFGLGYTPFALGGWIWVIDLHGESRREVDREYFYPAPDQEGVPLVYPPTEVPSPVPAGNKDKLAGYAITVLFDPRLRLTAAAAKLMDEKGTEVDGWFSTPDKPAIAGFPQRLLCFLPREPLRPDTRYTAAFQAEVNGRPWQRSWSFTTLKQPDRYSDDLEGKIVARVNAVRKAAGLSLVRLDAELSRGCQAHARYLALNHQRSATLGMGVHRQDADLPGASPEGARAAKESVIAVVLDPQTCVENWMATLYHRVPILTPNLERVGFGHARVHGHKWACVLDTGNGLASASQQPVRMDQPPR